MAQAEPVYLGLGSNVDAERHLAAGVDALRERFGRVECSPVYRSEAVGFSGDDFLNACCRIESDLSPEALKAWLTGLEDAHGRRRDLPKFSDRTLDIDVLLFGEPFDLTRTITFACIWTALAIFSADRWRATRRARLELTTKD